MAAEATTYRHETSLEKSIKNKQLSYSYKKKKPAHIFNLIHNTTSL